MNNIIAFWDKLTYNDILLLIIILCLIVYYIFLEKKQYEGMTQNSCAIIGNHKYDSYCESNQAKKNNNCESKCSTIVPGLGNVCCESSCCLSNTTPNNLPDMEENNSQILNDIQSLQTLEQELFSNLENQPDLTLDQQKDMINKINNISNMRVNLYETLGGVNDFFKSSLYNSTSTLLEQTKAIEIVEQELNKSKKRLELLEEEKSNKIRLVEINTYYGQKYAEHSDLMKNIIYILIPVLIFTVLKNKGILSNSIYYILVIIITVIGSFTLWNKFMSIMSRDSMNYQEYNWYFDAKTAPAANPSDSSDPWASNNGSNGTCMGQACCPNGLTYDISANKCIVNNSSASTSITTATSTDTSTTTDTSTDTSTSATTDSSNTTESFVSDIFTKHAANYNKSDVILGNNIKPRNSSKFW
uniref:Uncharacterized protein n=1 Tax=viral metagenome TaxID=1070528 RepID=A0A6C0IHT5_9ZZZZ